MREKARKGIYIIPNLFTTANMFSGFYAIIATFNEDYFLAAIAILIATIFDNLDGKVARLTKTTSRFGVEYDSLADLVSFGLAPGLLAFSWALNAYGRIGWVAAFLFVVCGALRLARFNVLVGTVDSKYFLGLPIPAAASLVATTILLDQHFLGMDKAIIRPLVILIMTYTLAFLMVSNIKYRSFKEFNLRERKPFRVLVAAILVLVLFAAEPYLMLFLFFAVYASSGIVELILSPVLKASAAGQQKTEDEEDLEDREIILNKEKL
jgi:CDP-diacylglycerol--serine O-phosphatidyltransferase